MKQFVIAIFIISSTAMSSQIEVSIEEYSQYWTLGNTYDFNADRVNSLWDVGHPGGDNYWDFSAAETVKETLFSPTMILPDDTPFLDVYPTATIIEFSEADTLLEDGTLAHYERYTHYEKLGSGLYDELGVGEIITTTNPEGVELKYSSTESYTRDTLRFQFPLAFGDAWAYNDTFSTSFAWGMDTFSEPRFTHFFDDTLTADAWGIIKLPNGVETEALRVRHFSSGISPSIFPFLPPTLSETTFYRFYTEKDGYLFVDVYDDNSEHSGVVEGDVLWIENTTVSSNIKDLDPVSNVVLSQNFPNPFRSTTTIEYTLDESSFVNAKIYDILGKEVDILVNQNQTPGQYSVQYDGSDLASGNYFIHFQTDQSAQTLKMMVSK